MADETEVWRWGVPGTFFDAGPERERSVGVILASLLYTPTFTVSIHEISSISAFDSRLDLS